MEEQAVVNNQIQQPPVNPVTPKPNYWIIAGIIFVFFLVLGIIFALSLPLRKPMSPPPKPLTSPSPVSPTSTLNPTANWKIYTDSKNMFTLKYPPNLYVKGDGQQVFLAKQDATEAEKIDYSDELVEIRIDNSVRRFESYYNTQDNPLVTGYNDLKLRNYTVDGYKAVAYGYSEVEKQKQIKAQEEAVRSGVSVTMIYFNKGIIVNKGGTIIEISTNAYVGEFKTTFDQILSTFKFLTLEQKEKIFCTQDVKQCPDGSYVSRQPPNCEFAPCPQK